MSLLPRFLSRPFIIPEILLALYIFVFAALFGPVFSPIAKLLGYASAGIFFLELLYRNKAIEFVQSLSRIWPYGMFYVVMALVVFPMLPYKGSLINSMTNFVTFAMVFYLVRQYRILDKVDLSFLFVIIAIGSLYFIFPSLLGLDAANQERIKMSSEVLGTGDSGGLNASGVALYCGLASFVALRCLATHRWGAERLMSFSSSSRKIWVSIACICFAFALVLIVSGSRQGLIWLVFVVLAAFAIRFKKNLMLGAFVAVVISLVMLLIVFIFFGETELVQRILILFDQRMMALDPEKSLLTRIEMYKEGFRLWMESPLWGNGNEAFRAFSAWQGHYSHSNYVEILVNYGLLGFVFYYCPMLTLLASVGFMLSQHRPEYRAVLIWLGVAVLAVLASGLFIPSFYRKLVVVFLAYLFGVYHNVKDDFHGRRNAPRAVPPRY